MKYLWEKIVSLAGSNFGLKVLAVTIAIGLWVAGHRDVERAVEVVRAVLDRIDRHDGAVNAFCWVDREGSLGSAKESEARWRADAPRGLIDGVPVGETEALTLLVEAGFLAGPRRAVLRP